MPKCSLCGSMMKFVANRNTDAVQAIVACPHCDNPCRNKACKVEAESALRMSHYARQLDQL